MIDPKLKQWATIRQAEYIDAVIEAGSHRKAALKFNVSHATIDGALKAVRKRAAMAGYSPDHHMVRPVPEPYVVKGTSTYFDRDGQVRGQWVKSSLSNELASEALQAVADALSQEIARVDPIEKPPHVNASLCNLFTLTDSHVGMMAWHKEGGADWDLKIAERTLIGCFEQAVMSAPKARVAIVNQLGDFLHSDSLLAVTPTSGHVLDQDGRYSKMVAAAIRILRRVIDIALMRHDEVHLVVAEGNHDMAGSVWLRQMFQALYENEPRLTVNVSELPYYVVQHGKTMLAFHHGHMKKNEGLPLLFAAQFPVMWGGTVKRYAHVGHRHHIDIKEHSGMIVIQHATLAARDAYAARGGWISERQMTAYTYHVEHGEVGSVTVTPEMLAA